ncbi:MAG: nuclear transport factor 2 family protein [Deltaproteobacteria bacterium]
MIEKTIAKWHQHLRGELPGGLDELLHEDCVFFSPVVFTPQKGRTLTKLYLEAASQALPGETGDAKNPSSGAGSFRYTKKIFMGHQAALEFETTVDGKSVNGIDIITCDDAGQITEFRVMIRPLQAVNAVHRQMQALLKSMQS